MTKEHKNQLINKQMLKYLDSVSNTVIEQHKAFEKMTRRMDALDEEITKLNEKLENKSDKPNKVDSIQFSENMCTNCLSQFSCTNGIEEVMWGHILEVLTQIRKEQQVGQELDEQLTKLNKKCQCDKKEATGLLLMRLDESHSVKPSKEIMDMLREV